MIGFFPPGSGAPPLESIPAARDGAGVDVTSILGSAPYGASTRSLMVTLFGTVSVTAGAVFCRV